MSTIFGIFQRDNKPVDPGDVDRMHRSMHHWHADDSGLYTDQQIMLGNLLLHNTPESLHEKQPFSRESIVITADARIDNREEIFSHLKEYREITNSTPDSILILLLYEKFGQKCLDYLIGDFAFVIWDHRKQELFCGRDHLGIKPFYFYADRNFFAFASEKKGLLSLRQVDGTVNQEFIYKILADYDPDLSENFHSHIQVLLPGHCMCVSKGELKTNEYWQLEIPPLLKLKKEEDYIEAFREQLFNAVECRLRSVFPIAAELSGGLDSSGITGMAARLMNDKGKLYTISNVLPLNEQGKKDDTDEEVFIDEVNRHNQIQHILKVTGSGWKHFLDPHELELNVHHGVEINNASWQEPLRRVMENKGIRVTLSGFSGDEAVTNKGTYYYFDFLEEGKYLEFAKTAFQLQQYSLPFTTLFRKLIPGTLEQKLNRDKRILYTPNSYLLDKSIEARLDIENEADDRVYTRSYKQRIRTNVGKIPASRRILNESTHGIMHKLEPRYPFADIRLLKLYLSLPAAVLGHPTINRYLFRRSMKDIIPENIRWRDDKTGAAGVYLARESRQYADSLIHWLNEISRDSGRSGLLQLIDIPKMIRGLDKNLPENSVNGLFMPVRSFRTEILVHYLSRKD